MRSTKVDSTNALWSE